MNIPPIEPLEDWVERTKPAEWEDWEWHKFLVGIARIYLVSASASLNIPMPYLLRFLSEPLPGELDS